MAQGITVLSSKQSDEFLPDGGTRTIYRVHVRTDRGAEGVIVVTPEHWNANDLPGILESKRDELDLAFVIGNTE